MLELYNYKIKRVALIFLLLIGIISAVETGKITGRVIDAETNNGLPGANVIVKSEGTRVGVATNIHGEFFINNVPVGTHTLTVTYIGYKDYETEIDVNPGEIVDAFVEVQHQVIEGQAVVVVGQATGQTKAINQQISSNTIKNIVAAERIQELPEANAAEAVGRLPGISIQRSGGEGNMVVIRGLSPKYNTVKIEEVGLASTSSDDRSTDLSMISPYMLEGIEVTKVATADQDANQLGGTVNFIIKKAPSKPTFNALAQGGYSGLRQKYGDYKFVSQASRRFFDNTLGIYANLDIEKRNRSSNSVSADYHYLSDDDIAVVDGLYVSDVTRDLDRYGATFVVDYEKPTTKIKFSNIASRINKITVSRSENSSGLRSGTSERTQSLTYAENSMTIMTNMLRFEQYLGIFKIDGKVSYALSENDMPEELSYGGLDRSPLAKQVGNNAKPADVPSFMNNDTSKIILNQLNDSDSYTKEDEFSADLNLEWDYRISDKLNIKFKIGGKYSHKNREYDYNEIFYPLQYTKREANNALIEKWPYMAEYLISGKFPYQPFIDTSYDPGNFMAGNYSLDRIPDLDLGREMIYYLQDYLGINEDGATEPLSFVPDFHNSKMNDYHGKEEYHAFYLMPTISFTDKFTFIPGVRYESNKTTYNGIRGNGNIFPEPSLNYFYHDTTITRSNEFILPMLLSKYKPFDWFDIRLSYTHTITRPSYIEFIPSWHISMMDVTYKNPDLKPSLSKNVDLYFSFYGDKIGLITLGGFNKEIEDLIFWRQKIVISDTMAVEEYGLLEELTGQKPTKFAGKPIMHYVNNPNTVNVWGIETEWQSNLSFLPGFLKNLVLNVNYTHIFSEASYPRTVPEKEYKSTPFGITEVIVGNIEEPYKAPMLDQPDDILNLTIGYDYKGFSIRGSMQYSSDIFTVNNWRPQLRGYQDALYLYDLSIKQELPVKGLAVYGNFKNLTNAMETNINKGTGFISNQQYYGMTADIGLRYRF